MTPDRWQVLNQYEFFYTLTDIRDWILTEFSCNPILFPSKQNAVHDVFRDEGIHYSQQCSIQQENHNNGFELATRLFSELFHQNKKDFFPTE